MGRKLTPFILLALGHMLSAASCDRDQRGSNVQADCKGVICTMMFAAVTVQVQDAAGNPVVLDSTVTLSAGGTPVSKGRANSNGVYTIIDDSYQKVLAMRTEQMVFKGYSKGRQVVDQPFTVSADCCHVSRKEGPTVLTVK